MIPTAIIIHHSLTKDGETVSWQAIRQYHMSMGWEDVGYHAGIELINNCYEILMGRMPNRAGAHCKEQGMNRRSLGICLVGNFDLAPPPIRAMDLLTDLTGAWMMLLGIPKNQVFRHSDFAPKSCPGKLFPWDAFIEALS